MEYKEDHECSYNERTKVLIVKKIYTKKNLTSTVINIYTEEKEIKKFLRVNQDMKNNAQKQINQIDEVIKESKEKLVKMKEPLAKLTPDQEKLIEDLRVVGTYQESDKLEQQIKQHESNKSNIEKNLKRDNLVFEKIKQTCKIKL